MRAFEGGRAAVSGVGEGRDWGVGLLRAQSVIAGGGQAENEEIETTFGLLQGKKLEEEGRAGEALHLICVLGEEVGVPASQYFHFILS
jgi:hypothetical protein